MLHPPAGSGFLFMKNTRIFYTDDAHIKMYEMLPAEDFKELFMAMLKYKYGDDTIVETIQNPVTQALFMREKTNIDANEKKWEERANTNRANGAKGGRPPKKVVMETEIEPTDAIQVEEVQTETKPQTQEPQRVFGTQGEAIDYLVEYSKTHGKHDTEYERNKICREYGFNYKSMIDEYMERRSMT